MPSDKQLQSDSAWREKVLRLPEPPKTRRILKLSGEHLANSLRARFRFARIAAGAFRVERPAPPSQPNYVPALRHRPEGGAA